MDLRKAAKRLIGRGGYDELTSEKLRMKFRAKGVQIGLYSYGCFDLDRFPAGVSIGRYCSFANTAQVFLRDHGLEYIGLTPYLYNERLGVVDSNMIEHSELNISDDVWLGHNAVITSKVRSIGRGAAIAAGAVVTKPVPAYAIVAGNPARVIRMRFNQETIDGIEKTRWWEKSADELRMIIGEDPDLIFAPAKHFLGTSHLTDLADGASDSFHRGTLANWKTK